MGSGRAPRLGARLRCGLASRGCGRPRRRAGWLDAPADVPSDPDAFPDPERLSDAEVRVAIAGAPRDALAQPVAVGEPIGVAQPVGVAQPEPGPERRADALSKPGPRSSPCA